MKTQKLWYVRSDGRVAGPFPGRQLTRDLLLGRLNDQDEVSLDRIFWTRLGELPELQPKVLVKHRMVGPTDAPVDWLAERHEAARRWFDERRGRDRRDTVAPGRFAANRRHDDRRVHPEDAEIAAIRQRHADLELALMRRRDRLFGVAFVLIGLAAWAVYATLTFEPVNPVRVDFTGPSRHCSENGGPQVNWQRCDKNGAWLKGVDLSSARLSDAQFNAANLSLANLSFANLARANLSFANLQQAKLVGADLKEADLKYAELRDADLRHADLRGADVAGATLIGARLDDAVWIDGRRCAALSVGECH